MLLCNFCSRLGAKGASDTAANPVHGGKGKRFPLHLQHTNFMTFLTESRQRKGEADFPSDQRDHAQDAAV